MGDLLEVEFDCFPMEWGGYADQANTIGGWLITSWFGDRIDPITGRPGDHGGNDLIAKNTRGRPFYSVLPGRVSQGWDTGGGGKWTSLFTDAGHYVGYGHALDFAPGVHGTHVPAGTLLGWCDSTGASTGDHMHFALNAYGSGPYDDPTGPLRRVAARGRYPDTYIVGSTPTIPNIPEDFMTPEDRQYIDQKFAAMQDFLSTRIEQAGVAGQAVTTAERVDLERKLVAPDGALVAQVARVRDEFGAAQDPKLKAIAVKLGVDGATTWS